ncbi:hypothetical protein PC41400_14540 [Paenibacillus chitinolyticus]|uniref:RDRP core domain-containing protein n=1 Tax=Paenibacillus chitinolyticus TaxID=79263 RepID=A0A410WWW4_9BACL|nr:hypothetical protein PC41400_14540 [Paenibacillus chitinolyticus]
MICWHLKGKEVKTISLDKQIYLYSVDTSAFYDEFEYKIHKKLNKYYILKKSIKIALNTAKKDQAKRVLSKIGIRIKKYKLLLEEKLSKNTNARKLREDHLISSKLVTAFESTLTRTINAQINCICADLIIVRTYYLKVLENLITQGFIFKNEKYVYLTASAGQIRTKKTVFIKESLLQKHRDTLTCGLTVEKINSLGGVNINKYLAYLALCFSASDPWKDFNIDRAIVVDDMETNVRSVVDFVDDKSYEITRQQMDIPINHTDGCGMVLPRKNKKSMMVRLPWVKGLLVPFPFDKFIREKSKSSKVKDIYGKEYDIIKDRIEVIFTKSQFKMWKYYSSWDEYRAFYKLHGCHASKCNEEDDVFRKAKLNYQMLQTLTDFSDNELMSVSAKTIEKINNIGRDRDTMLSILGVKESNNKDYFQQALELYPELLNDTYSREVLKQVKKSIVKEAKSGKIDVEGYYTFVSPDLYAFCEYLFLNDLTPAGLLDNGQVYCSLFKEYSTLDCLRSPHLYREHAVRQNIVDKEKSRWFVTKGVYTSCHDPISKLLQFDVDGDKSLVCADSVIIDVAKRNMKEIVPLYYNMSKAEAQMITDAEVYNGLAAAYTGGNIGLYSNNITKIWNSENPNLDVIKLLCCENNFVIDYAKTLYKPTRPDSMAKLIKGYTKAKNPNFFIYAKDKSKDSVENANASVVNRLQKLIPNPRLNFRAANLGQFTYKTLLSDTNKYIDVSKENNLIEKFKELDLKRRFFSLVDEEDLYSKSYRYKEIRDILLDYNTNINYIVDVLVEYLYVYKKSSYKTTLWSSFGDVIVENIKRNVTHPLKGGYILCNVCGDRILETSNRRKYCERCWKEEQKRIKRESWHKHKSKYRKTC